jgi:DNA polymerase-3 subunit delta'
MVIDQTMSDFDQMQYQSKVLTELRYITQTKKIPNALLFFGNENTGRKKTAFLFAKECNCLSLPRASNCNCRSCKKIDANSHPDILCIDKKKDKNVISISQIREMALAVTPRPNEAKFRMVLILNADFMNPQAQNALLKLLEEPPEKTFFILIAAKISQLLSTIISRCRKIRFKPLTNTLIEQHLIKNFKVDKHLAYIAARTSDSDLKKAKAYLNLDEDAKDVNWIKRRKWLLDSLSGMIKSNSEISISKGIFLSQKLSLEPELINDTLAIMKTFFRDLMIFKHHPNKIVNLDFFDTFTDINGTMMPEIFCEWIKDLYKTEKRLASNSTIRLTLDKFFLKIVTNKGKLIND